MKKEQKNLGIKKVMFFVFIFFFFILLIFSVFFSLINISNSNILNGISINNIDVSGLSRDEASSVILEKINNKTKNNISISDSLENRYYYYFSKFRS